MYAHRSSPSFSKIILRLFAIISIIFLLYYSYSTFAEHDPLRERLYELGYPEKGFIFQGDKILWSDGHLTVLQGEYVEDYPITAEQAYNLALQYLASYNVKLKRYGMKLEPKRSSLAEKEKDGQLYWIFELTLHSDRDSIFAGFVWVNRKTGAISIKGLLG